MKPDFKFLKAFTWLSYIYLLTIIVSTVRQFTNGEILEKETSVLGTSEQIIFLTLLLYLTNILVTYGEKRLITFSFYFYALGVLQAIGVTFFKNQPFFVTYIKVGSVMIMVSIINLAIQVFSIKNPQLKKQYRFFGLVLIFVLFEKAGVSLFFAFAGALLSPAYSASLSYINITELLLPLSIILLLKATKTLSDSY